MRGRKLFHAVGPYLSAVAVVATAAILIFAIYFTELNLQWITFLTGVLVAAILSLVGRTSHAQWTLLRRSAQLSSVKEKLEREIRLRKQAEETIASGKSRLHLIDEVMSERVAFVDTDGRYRYHNRAFRDGLNLRPEQIDGRRMREVLGAKVHGEMAAAVRQSLEGRTVRYEQTQKMPSGASRRLSVQHLPQFGGDGKVTGFHILATDVTEQGEVSLPAEPPFPAPAPGRAGHDTAAPNVAGDGVAEQDMFVDLLSEQITGRNDAGSRIMAAIENDEFRLFCQRITPLAVNSAEAEHYEILIRLMEEEENMMPPGAFFPLAEKYGLMPHLDRWVVQHVIEWVSSQDLRGTRREGSIFFINMAGATIHDPEFPDFVRGQLQKYGVPGAALCFEITDSELTSTDVKAAEFARQIRQCGCRVALSGFGRDRISFELLHGLQAEFLKIDGSIILDILRDRVDLAKVTAINRVAKTIGMKTIAEFVESDEIVAKLRELTVDFAQGFGISRPRPLVELGSFIGTEVG